MANNRSQEIIEQMLVTGTFFTDFTIETKNKTFEVHRSMIAKATTHRMVPQHLGAGVWVLETSTDIAEDMIRHSHGLQVSRLPPVPDSELTGNGIIHVLELFIEAGNVRCRIIKAAQYVSLTGDHLYYTFSALEDDCYEWLSESLVSARHQVDVLIKVAEYLYKTKGGGLRLWEPWPELVANIANSMGEILAAREDLLARIIKIKILHRAVPTKLVTRLEAANKANEDKDQ